MANEVNQLTINAAGTGWVDSTPSAISTGYQAQNTNIQAHSVGQDLSSVRVSGTSVIIDISGPIDVDGIPFSVTSAVTLTPSSSGVYYIQVVAGATATQKSLELTTSTPVWDAAKNGLYNSGNRVLNWIVDYDGSSSIVFRIFPNYDSAIGHNGAFYSLGTQYIIGNMDFSGFIFPSTSDTNGLQAINSTTPSWIIPRGVYSITLVTVSSGTCRIEYYDGTSWVSYADLNQGSAYDQRSAMVFSNGNNFRVALVTTGTITFRWIKH